MPRRRRRTYDEIYKQLIQASQAGRGRRTAEQPQGVGRVRQPQELGYGTRERLLFEKALEIEAAKEEAIFKHQLKAAEQAQEHQYSLDEELFKQRLKAREEEFKKALEAEKLQAETINVKVDTDLKRLQAREVIDKPIYELQKRNIEQLNKNKDIQAKLQMKQMELENTRNLEIFKAKNAERLFLLQQQLQPQVPQGESTFDRYQRFKNSGAFRTYGDIAKFWLSEKKKPDEVRDMVKMELQVNGVDYEKTFGLFREGPEEWQKLFKLPLPVAEKSPEATAMLQRFRSRVEAEMFLKDEVSRLQRAGIQKPEELKQEENFYLQSIAQAFPNQPSVYHQLFSESEARAVFGGGLPAVKQQKGQEPVVAAPAAPVAPVAPPTQPAQPAPLAPAHGAPEILQPPTPEPPRESLSGMSIPRWQLQFIERFNRVRGGGL